MKNIIELQRENFGQKLAKEIATVKTELQDEAKRSEEKFIELLEKTKENQEEKFAELLEKRTKSLMNIIKTKEKELEDANKIINKQLK